MTDFQQRQEVIIGLIAHRGGTYGLSMRPAGIVNDLDIHADLVAKVVGSND